MHGKPSARPPGFYHPGRGDSAGVEDVSPDISVTVHSVQKTTQIRNSHPLPGNVYLVANLTIENQAGRNAYLIDRNALSITDGGLLSEESQTGLNSPMQWGRLEPRESRSGGVLFGVREGTHPLTLTFLDDRGRVVHAESLGDVPCRPYVSDEVELVLPAGDDLASVVETLKTAEKVAQYTNARFTYKYHDGCISYPPRKSSSAGEKGIVRISQRSSHTFWRTRVMMQILLPSVSTRVGAQRARCHPIHRYRWRYEVYDNPGCERATGSEFSRRSLREGVPAPGSH